MTTITSELPAMLFSRESDERATPWPLFNWLNSSFQFTLDPCATAETAKCDRFYTREDDGLSKPWTDERVFMNPPYSEGNALDVVYDYEDGVQVLRGLKRHGSDELIPLPEADGLVKVLQVVIAECRDSYRKAKGD